MIHVCWLHSWAFQPQKQVNIVSIIAAMKMLLFLSKQRSTVCVRSYLSPSCWPTFLKGETTRPQLSTGAHKYCWLNKVGLVSLSHTHTRFLEVFENGSMDVFENPISNLHPPSHTLLYLTPPLTVSYVSCRTQTDSRGVSASGQWQPDQAVCLSQWERLRGRSELVVLLLSLFSHCFLQVFSMMDGENKGEVRT